MGACKGVQSQSVLPDDNNLVAIADNGSDAWFMSLVDWETGKTVYEYRVGSGRNYPDMLQQEVLYNGAFYRGTRNGMLRIRDGNI
jgi:hypothetical protein